MTFPAITLCTYPASDLWEQRDRFTNNTWHAKKFVSALKGEKVNGFAWIPLPAGRRRLDNSNRNEAFAWFGEMASQYIKDIDEETVLIPVPGHACTTARDVRGCGPFRMAQELSRRIARSRVETLLTWTQPLTRARDGGPRFADELYPYVDASPPTRPARRYVLVDDVRTSGGHLRACEAGLRQQQGIEIEFAVCAGRTVQEQEVNPFEAVEEELDRYLPGD